LQLEFGRSGVVEQKADRSKGKILYLVNFHISANEYARNAEVPKRRSEF